MTLPVIEEELQVGKRTVETGGVRVETNIEERPVEKNLSLKEEEINVERRAVNRDVTQDDLNKSVEGEIKIPVIAEVSVVAKEACVVEEIVISKNVNERDETVSDTVRRTDVEVEELSGEQLKKNSQHHANSPSTFNAAHALNNAALCGGLSYTTDRRTT